jgi:hypothetical protein
MHLKNRAAIRLRSRRRSPKNDKKIETKEVKIDGLYRIYFGTCLGDKSQNTRLFKSAVPKESADLLKFILSIQTIVLR